MINIKDFCDMEQFEKTADMRTEEMEYYCVAAFGEKTVIDPITKRFSLWH